MNDTHSHRTPLQLPQTSMLAEQRALRILPGDGELSAEPAMLSQAIQNGAAVVNESIDSYDNNVLRTSRTRTFSFDTANEIRRSGLNWTHRIIKVLSDAPVVPAAKVFYYAFRYVPADEESSRADSDDLASSRLRVVSSQFAAKAECMIKSWESIKLASVFFIGAAPVILQIQPVYMNVTTRALTVASGLLATASLVSGHMYVQAKDRFTQLRIMEVRWKAARDSGAEFWKLVALPFAFILWSALSFMGTVGYFVWGIAFAIAITDEADQGKGVKYGELVISAAFVTSIPIFAFIKIYNAMAEINGNEY